MTWVNRSLRAGLPFHYVPCITGSKVVSAVIISLNITVLFRVHFIYLFMIFIFTLFCFTILYWFCHTLTWISHGCTWVPNPEPPSPLPPHIISLDHPRAPTPSILYPVLNIDWWFISYMIVHMFQCYSPKSSHPLPLPQSLKVRSIHLCLFCCLAYRFIITIFLNSIYMCQYTVLVFFFLAYFTLYNRLQFHPPH